LVVVEAEAVMPIKLEQLEAQEVEAVVLLDQTQLEELEHLGKETLEVLDV
jgi:hypothetical protein